MSNQTEQRAQHTPGPWTIRDIPGTRDKDTIYITGGVDTGDGYDLFVSVNAYGRFSPDRILSARANARLIAAAPDLLEACKIVLANETDQKTSYYWGGYTLDDEESDALKAAIAKAEGREPSNR